MRPDTTRNTFRPAKHYNRVLHQQGRPTLGSDLDEQSQIEKYRTEAGAADIIGHTGGPFETAGFKIDPTKLTIGMGHYYVDGILVENDEGSVSLDSQPDYPLPVRPTADGLYLVYLDVFDRHITALEDPAIREVALGGPDTCTRTQTVWQVKVIPAKPDATCLDSHDVFRASTLKMSARVQPGAAQTSPCIIPASAGYQGLENHLYRVEIHTDGKSPTFKWSRENGSVAYRWLGEAANVLTIDRNGRDSTTSIKPGDWIELIDAERELVVGSGHMVQVMNVDETEVTIASMPTGYKFAKLKNPRIRRWESPAIPLTSGTIQLEDGIEITFTKGTARVGEYWNIPARVLLGDVEWDAENGSLAKRPQGEHHYARLATILIEGGKTKAVTDCRNLYPLLTDMQCLDYVSGDGQSVTSAQGSSALIALAKSLKVGVSMGKHPIPNAKVKFSLLSRKGQLKLVDSDGCVVTDDAGIATCEWLVDPADAVQQVQAQLVDARLAKQHLPVIFTAEVHPPVSECCEVTVGESGDYPSLDVAIHDLFVKKKRLHVAICLMAQEAQHVLTKGLNVAVKGGTLVIKGFGPASHLSVRGGMVHIQDLDTFNMFNVSMAVSGSVDGIRARGVRSVRIEGCSLNLSGTTRASAAIRSMDVSLVKVCGNTINAIYVEGPPIDHVTAFDPGLANLILADDRTFSANVSAEAERLHALPVKDRQNALKLSTESPPDVIEPTARRGTAASSTPAPSTIAASASLGAAPTMSSSLAPLGTSITTAAILDHLVAIRNDFFKTFPASCIHVESSATTVLIENNLMLGNIVFYKGEPAVLTEDEMKSAQNVRPQLTIRPSEAGVWVRGNRFYRFLITRAVADVLLKDAPSALPSFREMRFEDNTLEFEGSACLASTAFFDGNLFIAEGAVALSVCDRDMLTGNVGALKDTRDASVFYDASNPSINPEMTALNYLKVIG